LHGHAETFQRVDDAIAQCSINSAWQFAGKVNGAFAAPEAATVQAAKTRRKPFWRI